MVTRRLLYISYSGVVLDVGQAELAFKCVQTFVCPHCNTALPDYAPDSFHWEHCDPRPPKRGASLADILADEEPYE